jgi:tetratricopeptide (TPR) repeat protein
VIATIQSKPLDGLAALQRSGNAMAAWQLAQFSLRNGQYADALAGYRGLVQQFPDVAQLWLEFGAAAAGELDFALADQLLQSALQIAPTNAGLLIAVSHQYYELRRLDLALDCLKRAVAANPASLDVQLSLASTLERNRRLDEAWECVETCLAQNPKNGQLLHLKAFLLHRQGLNQEAENLLRDLACDPMQTLEVKARANHLLAVVLDASDQYEEALKFLGKAKHLRLQSVNAFELERAYDKSNQARRDLLAELRPETIRRWREESAESPCPHPLALLGGVMRSGTSLIEQILGAHPDVLVFDESMTSLKQLLTPLNSPPPGRLTLESLNGLSAGKRSQLIGRYLKSLLRETEQEPGGKLLLDKNPSTTAWLHIWLRLFPHSKVITALRDPRDVVISCYFMDVPAEWGIVNFSTLDRAAKFYGTCVDVWLRMRELGGFDWIETRYEDVVNNLESEGKRITSFLGLPWHESQSAYHETARAKFVHSPTYNEVAKPIYTRAVARWKHYAEALAPIQPALEKYCKAFGYSVSS